MSQCKATWFRGCKFAARYDEGQGSLPDPDCYSVLDAAELLKASKPKIYVRDVCERCGITIERTDTSRVHTGGDVA